MPCDCGYMYGSDTDGGWYKDLADRATRAACDMRTIIRRAKLESKLCAETLAWIAEHDAADAKRIAKEKKKGQRRSLRKQALAKLNLDERRVLGL